MKKSFLFAAIGALFVLLALLVLRGISLGCGALPIQAIPANTFLNSMGAGTHLIQGEDPLTAIENGITYSGVRWIRDDFTNNAGTQAQLVAIHAATGAMIDELPGGGDLADTKTMWETLAAGGAMLAAEGSNELDNFHFTYAGQLCGGSTTWLPCAEWERDLYAMVKGDTNLASMRVWAATHVGAEPDNQGLQFLAIPNSSYPLPSGTTFADEPNCHNYISGNTNTLIDNQTFWATNIARTGAVQFDSCNAQEYWGNTFNGFASAIACEASGAQSYYPNKVITETGTNLSAFGGETQAQQGKLATNMYLQAYRQGWQYTNMYRMFSCVNACSGDNGWGMFQINSTGNEADAGNATSFGKYTHNLTTILNDNTSAFTIGYVPYFITGMPSTGYSMLLEKHTGVFELAVWGEAYVSQTSTSITVNLGAPYTTVNVYDVTSGTVPVATYPSGTSAVPLNLNDHAFIVEFHN